jgi:hypothetical protein
MRALLASVVLACGLLGTTPAWAQLDPCLADPVACVGETVGGVTETVEETVQNTTETVTDTVGGLTGSGEGVVGGGSDPESSGGGSGTSSDPGTRGDRRSGRAPATGGSADDVAAASTAAREATAPPGVIPRQVAPDVFQRIRRAFTDSAGAFVFPLALIGIVGAFLVFQSRVDRSDPKLALAPIDARDDVLEFR